MHFQVAIIRQGAGSRRSTTCTPAWAAGCKRPTSLCGVRWRSTAELATKIRRDRCIDQAGPDGGWPSGRGSATQQRRPLRHGSGGRRVAASQCTFRPRGSHRAAAGPPGRPAASVAPAGRASQERHPQHLRWGCHLCTPCWRAERELRAQTGRCRALGDRGEGG